MTGSPPRPMAGLPGFAAIPVSVRRGGPPAADWIRPESGLGWSLTKVLLARRRAVLAIGRAVYHMSVQASTRRRQVVGRTGRRTIVGNLVPGAVSSRVGM